MSNLLSSKVFFDEAVVTLSPPSKICKDSGVGGVFTRRGCHAKIRISQFRRSFNSYRWALFFCLLMDSIFAKFLTLIIFIICRFLFIPCKLCRKLAVFSLFTSSNKVLLTYSCTKRNILQNRILENDSFRKMSAMVVFIKSIYFTSLWKAWVLGLSLFSWSRNIRFN